MTCRTCKIKFRPDNKRPTAQDFEKYVSFFLRDNPDETCAKGGHAAYSQGVNLRTNKTLKLSEVQASYFMSYHTVLKTSKDYYSAMSAARHIAANISRTINAKMENSSKTIEVRFLFSWSIFAKSFNRLPFRCSHTLFSTFSMSNT